MKALEQENRELRQANEILRKASAYFAMAELDRLDDRTMLIMYAVEVLLLDRAPQYIPQSS